MGKEQIADDSRKMKPKAQWKKQKKQNKIWKKLMLKYGWIKHWEKIWLNKRPSRLYYNNYQKRSPTKRETEGERKNIAFIICTHSFRGSLSDYSSAFLLLLLRLLFLYDCKNKNLFIQNDCGSNEAGLLWQYIEPALVCAYQRLIVHMCLSCTPIWPL